MTDRRVPAALDRAAALGWRFLVVIAALAVLGYLLVRLRLVVIPMILALFLTALLVPPERWLERRGWPPAAATLAVLTAAVLLLVGVGSVVVPQFVGGLGPLGESVLDAIRRLESWLAEGPLGFSRADVEGFVDQAIEQARTNASGIASGVLGGAVLAIEVLAGLVLMVVVTFFFVKDGERIMEWFYGLFPEPRRPQVRGLAERTWRTIGAYIRGVAVIAVVDAVLIAAGLLILRVPLVLPLAVLVFFGAFLPLVGAFLSGLLAVLVALVTGGLVQALLVVALIVGVQQVEGHVLAPIVLGRAVQLHPLVIILALTAGAVLGGVIGAFLAVPIAGVLVAVGTELRKQAPA
ncbi:MAG: AI-2E family transporter [Acidimicrobiia bacterium]